MKCTERVILFYLIGVSLIFSGFAFFRFELPTDLDVAMLAVAILSTLVVVLVGWNIYTFIDAKKIEDRTREAIDARIEDEMEDVYVNLANYSDAVEKAYDDTLKRLRAIDKGLLAAQLIAIDNKNGDADDFLYALYSIYSAGLCYRTGETDEGDKMLSKLKGRLPSDAVIDADLRFMLIEKIMEIKKEFDRKEITEAYHLIDSWEHTSTEDMV